MKKKLMAFLCVIAFTIGLCSCGNSNTESRYTEDAVGKSQILLQLLSENQITPDFVSTYRKDELVTILSSIGIDSEKGALGGLATTYAQSCSDMGGLVEIAKDYTTSVLGKEIIVKYNMVGVNANGTITFTFSNDIYTSFKSGEAVAKLSIKQNLQKAGKSMGTAGLNTLLGMGTVFSVLILISIIISCFSLFSKAGKKVHKEESSAVVEAVKEVIEDTQDLTDDTQLVAVIMAAIKAYEGNSASADGFVVRSIRRVNRRN